MQKTLFALSVNEQFSMMKIFLWCTLGATAEVEALKKDVAEAEKKAVAE